MESKICSYTEKGVRLQLVRLNNGSNCFFELRFNRRIIRSFTREQALFSRHIFSHLVSRLCVDRDLTACQL